MPNRESASDWFKYKDIHTTVKLLHAAACLHRLLHQFFRVVNSKLHKIAVWAPISEMCRHVCDILSILASLDADVVGGSSCLKPSLGSFHCRSR